MKSREPVLLVEAGSVPYNVTEEITMAPLEILEGTWEELSAHAEQLKGRQLRLIVLPQETTVSDIGINEAALREAAMRLFAESDNVVREPGKRKKHEVSPC